MLTSILRFTPTDLSSRDGSSSVEVSKYDFFGSFDLFLNPPSMKPTAEKSKSEENIRESHPREKQKAES